jgi:acyl-CoA thioesterase-2
MAEPEIDINSIVEETIEFVTVRPDGDGWVGDAPDWFGERLFGGFVLSQSVHAATRTAPDSARLHSLHGYFLRPVFAGKQLSYRVAPLREGRTFVMRQLEAVQDGEPVFAMMCSFTADTDGYEYELPIDRDVPAPDGTRTSTHRAWSRIPVALPDDPHLHAALIAFVTDITGTGGRPLHLEGDVTGMVSIDHAAWFHRPLRADEWLFYDVHSLVNTGGRGVLRGTMYGPDRHVAVSVAQEMLLRPVAT